MQLTAAFRLHSAKSQRISWPLCWSFIPRDLHARVRKRFVSWTVRVEFLDQFRKLSDFLESVVESLKKLERRLNQAIEGGHD